MISISRGGIVVPMEIFVSCVGDVATVEGSVLVVTSFHSPPGSYSFCLRGLGDEKVLTLAVPLRSGRAEFLRCRDVGKTHEWDDRYLDTYSAGA
jgi:hypothetical protein